MNLFVEQVDNLRDTIESTHQQIAKVAEPLEHAARDIRTSNDRAADALGRTEELVGRVEASVHTFGQHEESVADAWVRYQARFKGIDQTLTKVFTQIDDGLSGYCEQVKEFANELDKTTANTVQQLAGTTGELNASIDDLLEHIRERPR